MNRSALNWILIEPIGSGISGDANTIAGEPLILGTPEETVEREEGTTGQERPK
jgi:hypothetical protein